MRQLHPETFENLHPSDTQMLAMEQLRQAAKVYAGQLEKALPEGADKTYVLRKFRETMMWANVCLMRQADGSPRASGEVAEVGGRGNQLEGLA